MTTNTEFDFKFGLGDEARDTITSFEGVIICRSQWLHNCNTYGVRSRKLKDGAPVETQHFDEPQLVTVRTKTETPKRDTGGPCAPVLKTNRF